MNEMIEYKNTNSQVALEVFEHMLSGMNPTQVMTLFGVACFTVLFGLSVICFTGMDLSLSKEAVYIGKHNGVIYK